MPFPSERPRRNRRSEALRRLVRENSVIPDDLILPLFVCAGKNVREPVRSMPGVSRLSRDLLVQEAKHAWDLGILAVALFPALEENLKDPSGRESVNDNGLLQTTIRALKDSVPELLIISDVALDPYSSDGHDGLLREGEIINDPTLEILGQIALSHARAGCDMVAPSDMMDGRVGHIRHVLDLEGFQNVGILAYAAKYASSFYGPFREALNSAPRSGDKKTYQMDPANAREALREVKLDIAEGADIVMVKPALPYLDIIYRVRQISHVPVAAYHVSGEYSMIQAAAKAGWIDGEKAMLESLTAIKRAGADMILTYYAMAFAEKF